MASNNPDDNERGTITGWRKKHDGGKIDDDPKATSSQTPQKEQSKYSRTCPSTVDMKRQSTQPKFKP
jgi:hypothetical protein